MATDNSEPLKGAKQVAASKWLGVGARVDGRCYNSISVASFNRLAHLALPNHDHDSRPVLAFAGWVNEDNREGDS